MKPENPSQDKEASKDNAQTETTLNTPKGKLPEADSSINQPAKKEETKTRQDSLQTEGDGTTISIGN